MPEERIYLEDDVDWFALNVDSIRDSQYGKEIHKLYFDDRAKKYYICPLGDNGVTKP